MVHPNSAFSQFQPWQVTLLREWYHAPDEAYTGRLLKLIGLPETEIDLNELDHTERPYTFQVEAALREGCRVRRARYDWDKRLRALDRTRRKNLSLAELFEQLVARHWLNRFISWHCLVPHGGQAIDRLHALAEQGGPASLQTALAWFKSMLVSETQQDIDGVRSQTVQDPFHLRETARWLLRSIGAETTARLAARADQLICPRCVVHCSPREITFRDDTGLAYYGCRACGQTINFKPRPAMIVAVLDRNMAGVQIEQDDTLRVNWLSHEQLFDFDTVEIIQATDEQVERFAVRVGNDTDPFRAPRYRRMRCRVEPACRLSPNTPRVLAQVFGEVI